MSEENSTTAAINQAGQTPVESVPAGATIPVVDKVTKSKPDAQGHYTITTKLTNGAVNVQKKCLTQKEINALNKKNAS